MAKNCHFLPSKDLLQQGTKYLKFWPKMSLASPFWGSCVKSPPITQFRRVQNDQKFDFGRFSFIFSIQNDRFAKTPLSVPVGTS